MSRVRINHRFCTNGLVYVRISHVKLSTTHIQRVVTMEHYHFTEWKFKKSFTAMLAITCDALRQAFARKAHKYAD